MIRGWVNSVRRNHALEHATVAVLLARHGPTRLAGRASGDGFFILGDVGAEELASCASEALERLQRGQSSLAALAAVRHQCGGRRLARRGGGHQRARLREPTGSLPQRLHGGDAGRDRGAAAGAARAEAHHHARRSPADRDRWHAIALRRVEEGLHAPAGLRADRGRRPARAVRSQAANSATSPAVAHSSSAPRATRRYERKPDTQR